MNSNPVGLYFPQLTCRHWNAATRVLLFSVRAGLTSLVERLSNRKICGHREPANRFLPRRCTLSPIALPAGAMLWLQDIASNPSSAPSRLQSWRSSKRYSMEDFLRLCDPLSALRNLRLRASTVVSRAIGSWPESLMPYLRRASAGINSLLLRIWVDN